MSRSKGQSREKDQPLNLNNTEVAFSALSELQLRQAWLLFKFLGQPWVVKLGPSLAYLSLKLHLPIKGLIKKTVFSHFCGGENIHDCLPRIRALGTSKIGTILDFAREGGGTEEDFDAVSEEIKKTIDMAAKYADLIPFAVFKPTGVAALDLLHKVDRGEKLTPSESTAFAKVEQRFSSICEHAAKRKVAIMIDAEESWIQKTVDNLALDLMRRFNKDRPIVFNTVQLYRHDRLEYIKNSFTVAEQENFKLGFKLVRGAYLEKENRVALEEGRLSPINISKAATDREYNQALEFCLKHLERISICVGTHNEESALHAVKLMKQVGVEPHDKRIVFAQLLGMSDHISYNLAAKGFRVAKYVPYGTVAELLPYLTRRAQENSSVLGQSSRELDLLSREIKRRQKSQKSGDTK